MSGNDPLARAIAAAAAASAAALLLAWSVRRSARHRRRTGACPCGVQRRSWSAWQQAGEGALLEPCVLVGAPLGPCMERWTPEYLEGKIGDRKISVHVSRDRGLDFVSKNFGYELMSFRDLLSRARGAAAGAEYCYYRSQHAKRNKPSSLESLAPLDEDFELPRALGAGLEVHSTVLRVASAGLRMWLHYDICDNFLCCVRGRKRVLLLPPSEVGRCYLRGSSSALGSRLLEAGAALWAAFPLARQAWERRREVVLEEGELLFLPALWLHCTEALGGAGAEGAGACVSLNLFFLRPALAALHDPRDVWANRELLPAQDALKALDDRVWPALRRVPPRHRAFYCRRLAAELTAMAEEADAA